jgi:hypothetical protein
MSKAPFLFAIILACALGAAPAAAQVTYGPSLSPSDEGDVDEVEEMPVSSGPPSTAVVKTPPEEASALSDELGFSHEELRSRFDYLVAAGLGSGRPWQGYGLEMGAVVAKESGILEERAYDVTGKARSAGASLRLFSSHFTHLSVEGILGYASWEGRVDPHGSDEDEVESAADKLSSGFRATGAFAGLAVGLTWVWESGLFLEWTPVGMRVSKMLQKDYDRDNASVDKAVKFAVERASFYGLTNLKVGYLF